MWYNKYAASMLVVCKKKDQCLCSLNVAPSGRQHVKFALTISNTSRCGKAFPNDAGRVPVRPVFERYNSLKLAIDPKVSPHASEIWPSPASAHWISFASNTFCRAVASMQAVSQQSQTMQHVKKKHMQGC